MERITETNNKAQEKTPGQAAIHAKRKIKTMLMDNVGVTLFSWLGSVAAIRELLTFVEY